MNIVELSSFGEPVVSEIVLLPAVWSADNSQAVSRKSISISSSAKLSGR